MDLPAAAVVVLHAFASASAFVVATLASVVDSVPIAVDCSYTSVASAAYTADIVVESCSGSETASVALGS